MTDKPLDLINRLRSELAAFADSDFDTSLTGPARKKLATGIAEIHEQLDALLREVDPIKQPAAVFDPAEPNVVGRFVALAMVAQPRAPLAAFDRFYGSGVYALYYNGDFDAYAPIMGTETPIYVGKANPAEGSARTPMQQGDRLSGRLLDHRRSIEKSYNLDVADFECRALVVQSGWQDAAEAYLIQLFEPVWNNETNILYGLGKHGDAATTRANKRSPWDTLHPGRKWALDDSLEDKRSASQIESDLIAHFTATTQYQELGAILDEFLTELRQVAS